MKRRDQKLIVVTSIVILSGFCLINYPTDEHTLLVKMDVPADRFKPPLENSATQAYEKVKKSNDAKILCLVLTINSTLPSRGPAIMDTWGPRCDDFFFSSNVPSKDFPTLLVGNFTSEKKEVTLRLFRSLRTIHTKYLSKYDWFFVADDDTYVIVENLRKFLRNYSSTEPHYFGFPYSAKLKGQRMSFAHGGSGYALSRTTLDILMREGFDSRKCLPWLTRSGHNQHADLNVGWCLFKLGIKAANTSDSVGRQRFFKENPIQLLSGTHKKELKWFGYKNFIRKNARYKVLSEHSISFHYMKPGDMYLFDFLIYDLTL